MKINFCWFGNCARLKTVGRKFLLLLLISQYSILISHSQEIEIPEKFIQTQGRLNKDGNLFLTSWATYNVFYSGYLTTFKTGEKNYFHQTNAFLGTVNLAIGLPSLIKNYNVYKGKSKIDLVNYNPTRPLFIYSTKSWMDVLVIGAGFIIKSRAGKVSTPEPYLGIGKGLILQGSITFTFDSIMYLLHRKLVKNLIRNQ